MQSLIDTNIVIDYLRGDHATTAKIKQLLPEGVSISTVSLAELYHGAEKSSHPKQNVKKINRFISIPEIKVLPIDTDIAVEYGQLLSELEEKGVKLAGLDVLIAATARLHRLSIVTSDKKHFSRLRNFGVKIEFIL